MTRNEIIERRTPFGTGTKCPSERNVLLIESQKNEKRKVGTNHFTEVSVKRESAVPTNIFALVFGKKFFRPYIRELPVKTYGRKFCQA